jgi:hypothetical protein
MVGNTELCLLLLGHGGEGVDGGGAKMQGHFVNSLIGLCEVFSFWANFCTFSSWISTHSKEFCGKISPSSPNLKIFFF